MTQTIMSSSWRKVVEDATILAAHSAVTEVEKFQYLYSGIDNW